MKKKSIRALVIKGKGPNFNSSDDLKSMEKDGFRFAALIDGSIIPHGRFAMISGASWFLPRLIGFGKATDLILTGRHLDAQEALEIG